MASQLWLIMSAALGFVCVFLFSLRIASWVESSIVSARACSSFLEPDTFGAPALASAGNSPQNILLYLKKDAYSLALLWLRNGIPLFRGVRLYLLRSTPVKSYVDTLVSLLSFKQVNTKDIYVLEVLVALALTLGLAVFLLTKTLTTAVLLVVLGLVSLGVFAKTYEDRQIEYMRDNLPEALRILASACGVGMTLPKAFEVVANETPGNLSVLFRHVVNDLRLGYSVSSALNNLHKRSVFSEISFLAVALDVQYIAGGSLVKVIQEAQTSIEQSIALRRQLHTQTAQATLSARVISVMPLAILGALSSLVLVS